MMNQYANIMYAKPRQTAWMSLKMLWWQSKWWKGWSFSWWLDLIRLDQSTRWCETRAQMFRSHCDWFTYPIVVSGFIVEAGLFYFVWPSTVIKGLQQILAILWLKAAFKITFGDLNRPPAAYFILGVREYSVFLHLSTLLTRKRAEERMIDLEASGFQTEVWHALVIPSFPRSISPLPSFLCISRQTVSIIGQHSHWAIRRCHLI